MLLLKALLLIMLLVFKVSKESPRPRKHTVRYSFFYVDQSNNTPLLKSQRTLLVLLRMLTLCNNWNAKPPKPLKLSRVLLVSLRRRELFYLKDLVDSTLVLALESEISACCDQLVHCWQPYRRDLTFWLEAYRLNKIQSISKVLENFYCRKLRETVAILDVFSELVDSKIFTRVF